MTFCPNHEIKKKVFFSDIGDFVFKKNYSFYMNNYKKYQNK